jgi:hypothetical protein
MWTLCRTHLQELEPRFLGLPTRCIAAIPRCSACHYRKRIHRNGICKSTAGMRRSLGGAHRKRGYSGEPDIQPFFACSGIRNGGYMKLQADKTATGQGSLYINRRDVYMKRNELYLNKSRFSGMRYFAFTSYETRNEYHLITFSSVSASKYVITITFFVFRSSCYEAHTINIVMETYRRRGHGNGQRSMQDRNSV